MATVEPNAQKLIDKYIQNKSAQIKQSTEMLLQLQKVTSNPMAINAVGAINLMSMLQSLFDKFLKFKKPKNEQERNELLLQIANFELKIELIKQQIKVNNQNNV